MVLILLLAAFFFFQAEDGIRDIEVTGVQTCALPILAGCGIAYMPTWLMADDLRAGRLEWVFPHVLVETTSAHAVWAKARNPAPKIRAVIDRKSTRLNSSHANISYAVFCLKKKKKITI